MMQTIILYYSLLAANIFYVAPTTELRLDFLPSYAQAPLDLAVEGETTTVRIEKLKCYLSNFELFKGTQRVFVENNSFHLLDASIPNSLSFSLKIPSDLSFSELRFNIGIDSTTHAGGVFGGDLDPMHGMYWTWQSGYINFKLEGRAAACPARKNKFQFHLGGYQYPFNTLQEVRLPIKGKKSIVVAIELDELLSSIDLATDYLIMSPNAAAVKMAQQLPAIFSIQDEN
ncbi:MAG: MbnP family protein [Saprospiraceae bacterium]